jgi:DNA-binding response OmpR family regulator
MNAILQAQLAERDAQVKTLCAIALMSDEICDAFRRDSSFRLDQLELRILVRLVRHSPHVVLHAQMLADLYPEATYPATLDTAAMIVRGLRRKFETYGVIIEAVGNNADCLPHASMVALRKAAWSLLP